MNSKPRPPMPPGNNPWPDFETLELRLKEWEREHAPWIRLTVEGRSPQQRPVYAVTLTDPQAPAEEKQHAVLSAVHAGVERSATATLWAVMDWLLSGSPEARDVLRRHVVVCMPVVNPDEYVEGCRTTEQKKRHTLLYTAWNETGVTEPGAAPEAVALQKVLDRHQPDLYADVHGISLDHDRYLMLESSASSPTRVTSRPYHQHIARLMDEAALEEGFPSDFQEDDRELQYWGPSVEAIKGKLWTGRDIWAPGLYAYARYHTLHVVMEITWPQSGLARFRRLFRIGSERWNSEPDAGYPNRIVGPSGMYQMIAAAGAHAEEKRQSRVELWSQRHRWISGGIDPHLTGKTAAVFALSPVAFTSFLGDTRSLSEFLKTIQRKPAMDAAAIEEFFSGWPHGQNRPEPYWGGKCRCPENPAPQDAAPLQHGMAFRLRIPFGKAVIQDLRVNGYRLKDSGANGFQTWKARGFTFIEIRIPPERTKSEHFFIVTCAYDPGAIRPYWL